MKRANDDSGKRQHWLLWFGPALLLIVENERISPIRLLLTNCSACKSLVPGTLPALERYTGAVYQVIRKARREGYWPADCQLAIVSARYGLVRETTLLEWYDLKMTPKLAQTMQAQVCASLDAWLSANSYDAVFIIMGANYRLTVQTSTELERLSISGKVSSAKGGLGKQLRQLRDWLKMK